VVTVEWDNFASGEWADSASIRSAIKAEEKEGFRELTELRDESFRERLLKRHEMITAQCRMIMAAKNEDYGAKDDPFRNFRSFGTFGILVRLSDKLARMQTFEERGSLKVKEENIEETAKDAINYLILWLTMREFGDECK
jgi:hypothetical protein